MVVNFFTVQLHGYRDLNANGNIDDGEPGYSKTIDTQNKGYITFDGLLEHLGQISPTAYPQFTDIDVKREYYAKLTAFYADKNNLDAFHDISFTMSTDQDLQIRTDGLANLALSAFRKGEIDEAALNISLVFIDQKDHALAKKHLAFMVQTLYDKQDFESWAKFMLVVKQSFPVIYQKLSAELDSKGMQGLHGLVELRDAEKSLESIYKQNPPKEIELSIADDKLKLAAPLVQSSPDLLIRYKYDLAVWLYKSNRFAEAEKKCQEILVVEPTHSAAKLLEIIHQHKP